MACNLMYLYFFMLIAACTFFISGQVSSKNFCDFPIFLNSRNKTLGPSSILKQHYNKSVSSCVSCWKNNSNFSTLVRRDLSELYGKEELCNVECNGVLCARGRNFTCYIAKLLHSNKEVKLRQYCYLQGGRAVKPSVPQSPIRSNNQLSIIVGFAVGGVMVGVIIAAIYLGRSNRNASPANSDTIATPVSLSYSEWISNYSVGRRGSKFSSNRALETGSFTSQEFNASSDFYNIIYGGNPSEPSALEDEGPTIIEVDEGLGIDESFSEASDSSLEEEAHFQDYTTQQHIMKATSGNQEGFNVKPILNSSRRLTLKEISVEISEKSSCSGASQSSTNTSKNHLKSERGIDDSKIATKYIRQKNCEAQQKRQSRTSLSSMNFSRALQRNLADLKHIFSDEHRNTNCSYGDINSSDSETSLPRNDNGIQNSISNITAFQETDSAKSFKTFDNFKIRSCNDINALFPRQQLRRNSL